MDELDPQHADPALTCVMADDVPVMRDVLRMHFSLLGWVKVIGEACAGAEALELIVRLRPDIAVLDMRMPNLSGFAVAAQLQTLEIPVQAVIFSAFASDENQERARQLGVLYVSKLDGLQALDATLRGLRAPRSAESTIHAG